MRLRARGGLQPSSEKKREKHREQGDGREGEASFVCTRLACFHVRARTDTSSSQEAESQDSERPTGRETEKKRARECVFFGTRKRLCAKREMTRRTDEEARSYSNGSFPLLVLLLAMLLVAALRRIQTGRLMVCWVWDGRREVRTPRGLIFFLSFSLSFSLSSIVLSGFLSLHLSHSLPFFSTFHFLSPS